MTTPQKLYDARLNQLKIEHESALEMRRTAFDHWKEIKQLDDMLEKSPARTELLIKARDYLFEIDKRYHQLMADILTFEKEHSNV